MEPLRLIQPGPADAEAIAEYRAAFPAEGLRVTPEPERIPGLDGLEAFPSVEEWLRYTEAQRGRISWFLTVRERDGRVVGCACLRHRLEYDDDDPDFASHIGYSIRPDAQGRGYGKAQLRLVLREARRLGLQEVRIICRDINLASGRVIQGCGGRFVDALHGEESGMTVYRWDVPTA